MLQVLVIGAGLVGVSAAISCALNGHKVVVLEAAKELAEIGAGIQVTPNCTKILKRWGVMDFLQDHAVFPKTLSVHRYADGKAPFIDLFRADLQAALVRRARELGVHFVLDARAEAIDFTNSKVTTACGRKFHADLIVGADGLWSRCRECFLGRKDEPRPTGDLAYRVMITLEDVEDLELQQWISTPAVHFWVGPKAHVVSYPIRGGKMYNIVLLVPDDLPPGVTKEPGNIAEMRKLFSGWDPLLQKFLADAKPEAVTKWKLMHRDEMETWINDKRNFVSIGDSSHPMLPYLAQGANSSFEDGAVLGELLGQVKSPLQLNHALTLYQSLRKKRGERIARETFHQRQDFHMEDGPEQVARDALFESQLGKEIEGAFPSPWTCPIIQPWLYGYDAHRETAAAVRENPFPQVAPRGA